MEIIEKMKDYIQNSDNKSWWLLQIKQKDFQDSNLIEQWRLLMNSSRSVGGISNRVFIRRYINSGGFWVRFNNNEEDNLMVFFESTKSNLNESGFLRHMLIRYYHSTKRKADMKLTKIKPLDNKTLFRVMNETINSELDKVIDNGEIPTIRVCKFGDMFGNGNKIGTKK